MAHNPYAPPVIEQLSKKPLRIPFLFEAVFSLLWFAAIGSAFYYRERMIESHRESMDRSQYIDDLEARWEHFSRVYEQQMADR